MRRVVFASVVGLSGLLALAACQKKSAEPAKTGEAASATAVASAPTAPSAPPHRKAGLWSQTLNTGGMHQTTKICLDADTDAKLTLWGQAVGKDACAKNAVTPTAGGWAFESECDLGSGGRIVSKGTAIGDFNSAYTVKVSSTTTGASMGEANGAHEMQLDAKWEGPCPAGMKGGDVHIDIPGMKGGMNINLEKMAAMKK
jgi:hypothetical protein